MKLPSQEQCFQYFEEYCVPENVREHCLKVQDVSLFLADELRKAGVPINLELVRASSLLHDLFKVVTIKNPEGNAFHPRKLTEKEREMRKELQEKYPGMFENQVAYEIFKDVYPELAAVLRNEGDPTYRDRSWEESIIHYVDYIMLADRLVSLDERFAYLRKMYQNTEEFWDEYVAYCKEEEQKLFSKLPFTPQQLRENMNND